MIQNQDIRPTSEGINSIKNWWN